MSLLAWYPLNGDTKDYSGNNRHMKSDAAIIDNQGKIGQSYYFDNAVLYNDGWNLKTDKAYSNFTVCAWVYPTESPADVNGRNIISFGSNSAIRFRLTQENGLWVLWGGPGPTSFTGATYNGKIALNQWTHVCYKLENSLMSLFINGKKVELTSNPKKDIYLDSTNFVIGGYNKRNTDTLVPEPWKGKLNDIRIYDEALTAMQIKEIAQAKICHYTCNEQMYENTKNLFNDRSQLTDNGVIEKKWINDHHIEFAVEANTLYKGIRLSTALAAKPLKKYTLSYKIQKIKGTLNRIRGHIESQSFNEISAKIDGISFGYTAGYNVLDNHDTHKVEVTISTKENITNLNDIYIQVNDTTNDYVKVRVWDIQVEEKDHATPFTPDTRIATLKDISGFGYDMTSPLEYSPIWKNDEERAYYNLNAKANFYINKPFSNFLRQFTLSAWVRTSDAVAKNVLGMSYRSNSDISLAISNGKLCLHSFGCTSTLQNDADYAISTQDVNDNNWHLLTATFDGVNAKTYIDGMPMKQERVDFNYTSPLSDCLSIANKEIGDLGKYESNRFEGDIRDARVYATALSDEDIKLLYQPEVIIDKAYTVRCAEINEQVLNSVGEEIIGINKNAILNFKEFSEIPDIQSGVHNLKLGNDILPVLIDMDNDGGRWARIFYHNNHSGTVLFSNDNDWAEAKETNINNPTTSDKYSILSKLEYFRQNTNCYFEFKLKYPTLAPNEQNIWKQKSNPTFETVKNYKPINISWTSQGWGGLERSSLFENTDTFIDGTVNHFNWYYAIGAKNLWQGGIPAWDVPVMDVVELWIRINDFNLFADINEEVSINRNNILTAKEFIEIY